MFYFENGSEREENKNFNDFVTMYACFLALNVNRF